LNQYLRLLKSGELPGTALCEDPQVNGLDPKPGSNRESIIDDVNNSKKGRKRGNLMLTVSCGIATEKRDIANRTEPDAILGTE
jgi:hypothetical protein